jgi:hypothetical protein
VFINTDNELLRENFHCIRIKEAKPGIILALRTFFAPGPTPPLEGLKKTPSGGVKWLKMLTHVGRSLL